MVESSNIPSAAALTDIYEENFKKDSKERMKVIKECLANRLKDAAEKGKNYSYFWDDSVINMTVRYDELKYLKRELKKLGFRVKLRLEDSWAERWYLSIRWGKDIDLRDIL